MFFTPPLDEITRIMTAKVIQALQRSEKGGARPELGRRYAGRRASSGQVRRYYRNILLIRGAADSYVFLDYYRPELALPEACQSMSAGTAILKEGQYIDTHRVSMHSAPSGNKHMAVCQRLGNVTVFRDKNKDGKLDFVNPQSGMFGINIHKGPLNGDWDTKNPNYSAGCQVFADADDFKIFLDRCKKEAADVKNVFSYTLLNESDF